MAVTTLSTIEELISSGDFQQALSITDQLDDIEIKLWKQGVILERMGEYEKAEEKALDLEKRSNSKISQLRALITLAYTSWRLNKMDQWTVSIEKGRSILENDPEIEGFHNFKGELYYLNGIRHNIMNQNWEALDNFKKSLEYREIAEDHNTIPHSLNAIGIMYELLGRLNTALDYHLQGLKLKREIGNLQDIYRSLINLGHLYMRLGEFNEAYSVFYEGVQLCERIGHPEETLDFYRTLADLERRRGKYDEAEDWLNQVVTFEKEEYDHLSLKTIAVQVKLCVDTGDIDLAEDYLDLMDEIYTQKDMPKYGTIQQILVRCYYKIKHRRPAKILSVQDELRPLIADIEIMQSEQQIELLVYLARSLLFELQIVDEESIIDELLQITAKLENIAEGNHMILEQLEAIEFKAKIHHIQGNTETARSYLHDGIEIARSKGFMKRAKRLTEQFDLLLLDTGLESKPERIENLELDHLLSRLVSEKSYGVQKIEDERPMIIMLLNEGGSSLYEYTFGSIDQFQHGGLIGSFISAIQSFGDQIFSSNTSRFNRIEHGGYSIICGKIGVKMAVYVYEGNSYHATTRFERLVDEIQKIDFISKEKSSHQRYSSLRIETLDDIVSAIFVDIDQ